MLGPRVSPGERGHMGQLDTGRGPCTKILALAVVLAACGPPQGADRQGAAGAVSSALTSSFATMYLRGTMNAWGTSAMALVADNTWQVPVTLSAGAYQYKYDASGTWSSTQNWGDNNN